MNNNITKSVLKNVLYVLGAQLVILFISVIRSFLLPAFLSIESYGYWQVYLFYSTYVGVFALGFNDGIYLRYGDKNYNELPFDRLRSAVRLYSVMLIGFTMLTFLFILIFLNCSSIKFPLLFSALNILILCLTSVFSYILQITNQLKRYSYFSIADKILVIISVLVMIVINNNNYKIIIIVDFIAKLVTMSVLVLMYKELLFGKKYSIKEGINEFKANINVGIKLLMAALMGIVVIGIGRFLIQVFGSIEEFATYSFGITITGLVLTAVTAISLVLYPTIKRLDECNYANYFYNINMLIISFNFLALLIYFPSYIGIKLFYNQYTEMLSYLNLLFAIAILQSKISILNNTFYKALRKEKEMMYANISSVIVFLIIGPLLYYFFKTIWSIAFATFLTMVYRCYASEIYLKKLLNLPNNITLQIEIILMVIFILISSFTSIAFSGAIYLLLLAFWGLIFKSELINLFKTLIIRQ